MAQCYRCMMTKANCRCKEGFLYRGLAKGAMSAHQRERDAQEKITELRRTIQFLCNTMTNVANETIDENPAMAKFILKDAVNDQRYEFR